MKIRFGTDGWRGIISDDFTFANIKIVAQAIADYLNCQGKCTRKVVVGYDTRFLSREYAHSVAHILAGNGINVFLSESFVPTPVLSYCTYRLKADCGIMVTASHNPPYYNGIKIKGSYGGSATQEIVEQIEQKLGLNIPKEGQENLITYLNLFPVYLAGLRELIDFPKLLHSKLRVVVDPMYGAVQGYLSSILRELGIDVEEIHNEINPLFGGINPEPIPANLACLKEKVVNYGADLGIATDGDGDRIAVIDNHGNYLSSQNLLPFFTRYFVAVKRQQGAVAKTFSTTKMLDRVAKHYNLHLYETPIGFKYICSLFLKENILIGGEESGGIGFQRHIPERDGILATLFLLEALVFYGQPLCCLMENLEREFGPMVYNRIDLQIPSQQKLMILEQMLKTPPDSFAGFAVEGVSDLDGVKLLLPRERWILFRASGTEPVVRIYAEAETEQEVEKLLMEGKRLFDE